MIISPRAELCVSGPFVHASKAAFRAFVTYARSDVTKSGSSSLLECRGRERKEESAREEAFKQLSSSRFCKLGRASFRTNICHSTTSQATPVLQTASVRPSVLSFCPPAPSSALALSPSSFPPRPYARRALLYAQIQFACLRTCQTSTSTRIPSAAPARDFRLRLRFDSARARGAPAEGKRSRRYLPVIDARNPISFITRICVCNAPWAAARYPNASRFSLCCSAAPSLSAS